MGDEMNKLLLILGVSGVGKSSIIKALLALDNKFVYIVPFTTRPSRGVEETKISISDKEMEELWSRGELLSVNEIHGIRCGTPRLSIIQTLEQNNIPVLDWPITCIEVMRQAFPNQFYAVYVLPPSIEILQQRLFKEKRGMNGHRLENAREELEAYQSFEYMGTCDLEIISEENKISEITQIIYAGYLSSSLKK